MRQRDRQKDRHRKKKIKDKKKQLMVDVTSQQKIMLLSIPDAVIYTVEIALCIMITIERVCVCVRVKTTSLIMSTE